MEAAKSGNEEVARSDGISHLPDDMLLLILSLVPIRTAMSTSLLSKRWNYVWKTMPTLVYDETCPYIGSLRFVQFCGNLNLFKKLLVLELRGQFVRNFVDSPVCFPSLKSLHLTNLTFLCKNSFKRILSACPALEDLILLRVCGNGPFLFSTSSPSLQRLSIIRQGPDCYYSDTTHEISAPSLKYVKIIDRKCYYNFVEDMPKLVEAYLSVELSKIERLPKVLSSLERLSIRLYPAIILHLPDSLIFDRLLHLELGYSFYSNLLLGLLKYFPNLRSLKLVQPYFTPMRDQLYCLDSVPECLSFHLEILQWSGYGGTQNEREAAGYILNNAHFLKTATISLQKTSMDNGQIMMKDLRSISKASASCQLVVEFFSRNTFCMF